MNNIHRCGSACVTCHLQTAFRRPEDNNHVHTEIPFSDGSIMRIANTPEQLAKHLQVGLDWLGSRYQLVQLSYMLHCLLI